MERQRWIITTTTKVAETDELVAQAVDGGVVVYFCFAGRIYLCINLAED